MAKNGEIGIAVIGCGRIAQEGHLPYFKAHKEARLAAAVDMNEDNRRKVCKKFGIPESYGSAEEMFSKTKPDSVLICTPSWAHKDLTLMAAESGAHVFCEKPMASTAADCREMINACEKAGVFFQLGMVKRFDAGIVKAKKMMLSGRLGTVSQIATYSLNPPAPVDTPMMETVKKWMDMLGMDFDAKTGWWRYSDPRATGGQLMEMGTHLLDFILFWTGENISEFSGFINKKRSDMVHEDQGTLVVKFPSGIIATAELNMSVTADNLFGEKARIYGDRATLAVNHFHGMWFGVPMFEYIPTRLTYYGGLAPVLKVGFPVPVPVGRRIYMHKLQADYFIDSIKNRDTDYFGFGGGFAADGESGYEVMKVIDAVYASGNNG